MQKSLFENFLQKYSLDGLCEVSHWHSDVANKLLIARAHTETKTVMLKVALKKWEITTDCKVAVPNATKVRKMLYPISDDVNIFFNVHRDRIINFVVSDKDCEAVCTIAEYDAFPETPDLDSDTKNIPASFDVEIPLTDDLCNKILKSISALSDARDVVIMNNKLDGIDIVINYSDINTNRIRLTAPTTEGKNKLQCGMGFSSDVIKAIIQHNAVSEKSVFKVTNVGQHGLATISFDDENFHSTYFLFPTRILSTTPRLKP